MKPETINKVISVAAKSPKGMMGLKWYLLICSELEIVAKPAEEAVVFSANGKEVRTNLITEENATKFKAQVKPGTQSILLYEFMNALVELFTDKKVPEKTFDKLGEKAEYYVKESTKILNEKLHVISSL